MVIREAAPPVLTDEERPAPPRAARRFPLPALILAFLLLGGAYFRFNGLNWDDGKLLHPDELHITDVISNRIKAPDLGLLLDPDRSPLNTRSVDPRAYEEGSNLPKRPRQFAYGSLPLFVTDFAAWIWSQVTDEYWNGFWKIFRVGRFLTALCDVITIALAFGLARRVYGTVAGLLTAAFVAFATIHVQLAHFFVMDTWTAAFITATLWATLVAIERGTARAFALAGFLAGCAMATKATVVIIAFPIATAAWLGAAALARAGGGEAAARFARGLFAAGAAAFIAFLLFEPYAVLNPTIYIRDIAEQSAIIGGKVDVPYTRQYIGTIPLLYQAKNLVGWLFGPLLGALALAGFAWALWRTARRRDARDIVLLAWVLPYLGLLALNEAKFSRYLLPITPILCAYAAKLLIDLGAFAPLVSTFRQAVAPNGAANGALIGTNGHGRPARRWGWRALGATGAASLVLVGTFLTTLAFSAIYSRPHTQVAASEWIYDNIPKGSAITDEYWDHPLPLPLAAKEPGGTPRDRGFYGYKGVTIDFYSDIPGCDRSGGKVPPPEFCTPNNTATTEYLIGKIEGADYIIESTNRIYGSITRTPWRSPVQQHYFELLFSGRLGFVKVYDRPSFPTLGPFVFDDGFMDESFTVYDHPRPMVFKKERELSRDELRALFAPAVARPLTPKRYPEGAAAKPLLLPQLVDRLPVAGDYAWNRALGYNGLAATLLWLLAVEVLGLLALPLTLWLFARFPDRGWGLSKPIGWLLFAYPIWLLASLRLGQFTLPFLLIALGTLAVLALLAAFRWRDHFRATLRGAGPTIAASEGIFLLAGGYFLALRVRNPDLWHHLWGGEKPMELAHLNGILRSVNFPPLDPWFADGTINYYYFGQYLVAVLVKLTGLPIEIAFNLAMPTISALVAGAAFSVAAALAALALRRRASRATVAAFGLLGTILFVGIGNLDGAARLIGWLREGRVRPLGFDFFWGGSRTIDGAITEFPYFTQIWADLHAHAVALPLTMLAVGIVVALVGRGIDGAGAGRPGLAATARWVAPYLALLALTLGAVACTNSWDVPTYLLVTGAGLFHALGRRDEGWNAAALGRRLGLTALGTLATGAAAYALYYPFFANFKALVGELARTRVPTPLPHYLDHFGLFVAATVLVLAAGFLAYWHQGGKRAIILGGAFLAVIAAYVGYQAAFITSWIASAGIFFTKEPFGSGPRYYAEHASAAALLAATLVLLLTLWVVAWGRPRLQFAVALLIAAVGVTLGPEIVFVADDLRGGDPTEIVNGQPSRPWERMNTVFKFYMQGWTLFAFGGVGAVAWLWDAAPRWSLAPFRGGRDRATRRFNAATTRGLAAGALAFLLCASFVYPVVATPIRVAEQFPRPEGLGPTLNGHRWMEYGLVPNEYPNTDCGGYLSFKDDYAAIKWLGENVSGTPVIAEASIGPYRGNGSRFAIATGLPTILGWDRHQYQQRPPDGIFPRYEDVRALYNSPDERRKLAILQRYHVSYVVVGAIERQWYMQPGRGAPPCSDPYAAPEGLATLEEMAGRYLTPVFQSGETVIYRVLPAAFSSGVAAGDPAGATASDEGRAGR